MAKSGNYVVKLRRRREGKTDYQARKALVISGKPRLVARIANRNVTVQILIAKPKGDEVLAAANSRELLKSYGWKTATANIPAAYLTGYLCGLKAKAKGIKEAILDIGLVAPTKGAKVFAALSGVLDGGVTVPHSEEKIVKERMKGEHISKYAKSLGVGSEEYNAKFTKYTAQGVGPEKITEQFTKVKAQINAVFKGEKLPPEEPETTKAPKEVKEIPAAEKAPVAKKAPAKKPAAKKEETPAAEEKAPAKKTAKKPVQTEPVKAEKAPKVAKAPKEKASKEKASKEVPKEKVSKKGEKKA